MQLSTILANIPFLRGFQSSNTSGQQNSDQPQTLERERSRAIEDSIDVSPRVSEALSRLQTENELSEEDVTQIASQTRSVFEANDNLNLGLDAQQARDL